MATTITVSYSELDSYRQCPLKHSLGYLNLWTREQKEGSPLARGSLWHLVMQTHYDTIRRLRVSDTRFHLDGRPTFLEHPSKAKTQEILEACIRAVTPLLVNTATGEQDEDQELIAWMYAGYLEQYGIDEGWELLGVERASSVRLLTERGGKSRFLLKYKIDLVIRDLAVGQIKVVDHKSASNFSRPTEIAIDDQFGLYTWAYHADTGKRPLSIIRSDARTQRNKSPMRLEDRFRRVETFRSDKELANIALDAYRTAKQAYTPGALVHSNPAPDRCVWRCDFLEPHIAMRKGLARPDVVLRDYGFYQREAKHQEYTKDEGQD